MSSMRFRINCRKAGNVKMSAIDADSCTSGKCTAGMCTCGAGAGGGGATGATAMTLALANATPVASHGRTAVCMTTPSVRICVFKRIVTEASIKRI
jgi:hypothetical protein